MDIGAHRVRRGNQQAQRNDIRREKTIMNVRTARITRRLEQPFTHENTPLWNEPLRKDVFEAHMQRLETLMEFNMAEQRAMNEKLKGEIQTVRTELKGDIKALDDKIGNVKTELKGDIKTLDDKIEGVSDRLNAKIDNVWTELKGDIKAHDAKIYALDEKISQYLVIIGIITTLFGTIITALQFWK